MQIFYAPGIKGPTYELDETESRHCIRVLRMTRGTPVRLIDGNGNLFEGYISQPDQRKCEITITEVINHFEERKYYLHIAISPLKNPERFEWFIEKSVEIGIDEITPLICSRTEKPVIKKERINNIIISAMKQSVKARKPVLNGPQLFSDFTGSRPEVVKMIAHCHARYERDKIDMVCKRGMDALILIGPEGDFTEDELEEATGRGFTHVHLGHSRLRTETAGVAACHSIYFINQ